MLPVLVTCPKYRVTGMNTLIISDLHLGARNSRADLLQGLLADDFDQLVLNGDIVDRPDTTRLSRADWRVVGRLRALAGEDRLVAVRGNHDVLPGSDNERGSTRFVAGLLGVPVLPEYIVEAGGVRYLVVHGDQFDGTMNLTWVGDVADWCYGHIQRASRPLAHWVKQQSKHVCGVVEAVERGALAQARQRGFAGVITGHTHFCHDARVRGIHYLNTGCWVDSPCRLGCAPMPTVPASSSGKSWPKPPRNAPSPWQCRDRVPMRPFATMAGKGHPTMPYPAFDRSRLRIQPLAKRRHDLDLSALLPLDAPPPPVVHPAIATLGRRLVDGQRTGAARILLMGAHVLRAGVARYLIDLMERGLISHIAMNGAGPIHDWEFALIGATTESVARYIQTGEFGLWQETGRMNDAIRAGARAGLGLGEALGRAILDGPFPHKDISVLAAGVPPGRAGHGPCRHRLRHHPRAPQLRRRRPGAGQLPGLPHLHRNRDEAGRRRAAQLRLRGHGAGGLPQGAVDGPQRGPPGGAGHPALHHRRSST